MNPSLILLGTVDLIGCGSSSGVVASAAATGGGAAAARLRARSPSQSILSRYPTPGSVKRCFGRAESFSSLCLSCVM